MAGWDQRKLGVAGLALAIVLFLALNVFSQGAFRNLQADLTAEGLYSVSDGTDQVLAGLEEPITLRVFVSRGLIEASPGLGAYAERVLELVERYVARSGGKIRLEVIDPEPFSPEEDRAVGFGLQGAPLDDAGRLGFFGIAGTNTTDDLDVIAFLQPGRESFLEYDLTRLVHNLANPKKKVVGLVSGIPIDADPALENRPWRVVEQMKQFFEVRSLGLDPEIEDDVDVLMIVHPFGLSDETLYAIDQHVMAGGKTMIFVDPFAEEGSRSNAAMRLPPDRGSDLARLFEAWGVEYDRDRVLGDLGSAQRVSTGVDSYGRPVITDYVAWLTLRPELFADGDVVTDRLRVVNVASAGFLARAAESEAAFEPLISSTPAAAPVEAQKVRFQPDPAGILKTFEPQDEALVLAARLGGKLKSAFPDGPPEPAGAEDGEGGADAEKEGGAEGGGALAHLAETAEGANMILVADSDILADRFWLQIQDFFGQRVVTPTADNANFVINALDNLSGSSALIGLRSRGLSDRPFEYVRDIQKRAELRYRDRERALVAQLEDVQSRLTDMQTTEKADGGAILSEEQKEAIEQFRREIRKIRRELRDVRRDLNADIDRLDAWLKVLNIGAMPALVAAFAVVFLTVRNRRMRRRRPAPVAVLAG